MRSLLFLEQKGVTLIEVMIGIAISGMLGGGIVTAMYQIDRVNEMGNARVTAVNQVENALYYINRDLQMAQSIQVDGEDYWLHLSWTEWEENNLNEVKYIYSVADKTLNRRQYLNSELTSEKMVANQISAIDALPPDTETSPPEKAWTIEITATTTSGHREDSETRQVKIIPRPGS